MTINQIIAFCLVAVLIAFVVVLAIMAVHAIELLKKTKTLVGKVAYRELEEQELQKIKAAEEKEAVTQ